MKNMISIIIPAYNEERVIERCLTDVGRKMRELRRDYEIIVVEESSDMTPEIVKKLAGRNRNIRHIHSSARLGKGGAIAAGISASRGEKIIFMDADLSTDLEYLPQLIRELDRHDLVMGSRYHPSSNVRRTFLRLAFSKIYTAFFRLMFGLNFRDVQCGFKGFSRRLANSIAPEIRSSGFFWDTELVYLAKKHGYSIKEIGIEWHERKGGLKVTMKMACSLLVASLRLFLRNI